MKKIVISGGSGLIGSALALKLVNNGYEVVILTRSGNRKKSVLGIRFVQWDAKNSGNWESELDGADSVVNLAGENIGGGLWTKKRKDRILNSRLSGGKALVSAIKKCSNKPALFIQASAIGIYGISETLKMDENSPLGDDFLSGIARQWEGSSKDIEYIRCEEGNHPDWSCPGSEGGSIPIGPPPLSNIFRWKIGFGQAVVFVDPSER